MLMNGDCKLSQFKLPVNCSRSTSILSEDYMFTKSTIMMCIILKYSIIIMFIIILTYKFKKNPRNYNFEQLIDL